MSKKVCICETPDRDGKVVHSGRIVMANASDMFMRPTGEKIPVCWKHRKFYKGWKKNR